MTSDTNALYAALAQAQAEMKNPGLDSTNPHFKNKYASLLSVREAVLPAMNRHGIAVVQCPVSGMIGDKVSAGVETILTHSGGGEMRSTILMPVDRPNAQGVGSAITYARRYALLAVAGLVGDPDDDGNEASSPPPSPQRAAQAKPTTKAPGQKFMEAVAEWSGITDSKDAQSAARKVMAKAGAEVPNGGKMDDAGLAKCVAWMGKHTFEELN